MYGHLILWICIFLSFPFSALAVSEGQLLIPFRAMDMSGESINIEEYIGDKIIVLAFWASWCPLCKSEVPLLNEIKDRFDPEKVVIFGINIDKNDSPSRARTFINKNSINYPVIYDQGSVITTSYKISGVPTVIITDRKGIIKFRKNYVPEVDRLDVIGGFVP